MSRGKPGWFPARGQEVRDDPNIILMIDEIHTLVGAGGGGDGGAMDAANILKPALARGDMQIIGAERGGRWMMLDDVG